MIKAAIIGATGYTGSELVRILLLHPDVEITLITSESRAGEPFSQVHPQFENICDLKLQPADEIKNYDVDVCFLALPHRVSMEYIQKWRDFNFKIIDLSGDYRLSSAEVYEQWYDKKHITPELVPEVPYGLPELYRDKISSAKIVANPGCYPTASILGLAPLIASGKADLNTLIVDAKSGTTGAGVKIKPTTHFSNVNDNFKAYGLKTHRHTIEIEEILGNLSNDNTAIKVQFTPHLLPVDRGILATSYIIPNGSFDEQKLKKIYRDFYQNEPFVRLRNVIPEIKFVRGTNLCDIFVTYDKRTNKVIVLSVIDNLVKGAAGQAVHNMNLMFNLNEKSGLEISPMQP